MSPGFHHRPIPKRSRRFAKAMRRNPTDAELAMWQLLRHRRPAGFKFRREVRIGTYIVDFVCFDRKTVIEIDGSQHFESQPDVLRDSFLSSEGFQILRYWNNDVLQRPASVLEHIVAHLTDSQV